MREFTVVTCGCAFVIRCADKRAADAIDVVFGGFRTEAWPRITRQYDIEPMDSAGYRVGAEGTWHSFDDLDGLLFHIDKDITLTVQLTRSDLFFLHAAVVALDGRAVVVAAPSGTGKSTLVLALLERGLEYLSDELAPIDLRQLYVHRYPHALCLKTPPPLPYRLPSDALVCGGRIHVPVKEPGRPGEVATLAGLVFLRRDAERFDSLRPVTAASATAHLIANTLNGLAHPSGGMDAALALSQAVPCLELDGFELPSASLAILKFLRA